MDNKLAIKKGFTLLEMTAVMVIVGVLLTVIINGCTNFVDRAKFQATVREMGSIAQAAIDYYNSSHNPNDPQNPQPLAWPSGPSLLSNRTDSNGNNMPQAVLFNPFGKNYPYALSFANNTVTVTTTVPKGILIDPNEGIFLSITRGTAVDQISITQSVPNEYSGRLIYDLQYVYKK